MPAGLAGTAVQASGGAGALSADAPVSAGRAETTLAAVTTDAAEGVALLGRRVATRAAVTATRTWRTAVAADAAWAAERGAVLCRACVSAAAHTTIAAEESTVSAVAAEATARCAFGG